MDIKNKKRKGTTTKTLILLISKFDKINSERDLKNGKKMALTR